MIRLAVNADDFGFTRGVNEGILAAHRDGILTSTTLMANGEAFDHAVSLALANPSLDVGCHLTLVGGPALTGGELPRSVPDLLIAILRGRIPVYEELAAQVRKIRATGLQPTHLDTHKHTHVAPAVLKAVARIARETGICWVRRPFDFMATPDAPAAVRLSSRVMRSQSRRFGHVLEGLRVTDHFVGFGQTGRLNPSRMVEIIRGLPEGLTEFMVHPGFLDDDLRRSLTRLKESREEELKALVSPEVRRALDDRGVLLTAFSA